jgi:hypothetical protein
VLGIRERGLCATKDTYISTALTARVNISWLEAQTGVRYETLKRRYGTWLRTEGAESSRTTGPSPGIRTERGGALTEPHGSWSA